MNPGERDWFYVGHYGQLGPLTFEQVEELARDGVITADTYVWSTGMDDWRPAGDVKDLQHRVQTVVNASEPPLFARSGPAATAATVNPYSPPSNLSPYGQWGTLPVSDKSRVTAGLLNLIPGVGRLYLGYLAHGVLQILLTLTCGVGIIWSFIDALFILTGGLKTDGYGRVLKD
jgi:TM2 domain-containing membrane protein YozV